ncbi:alpha-ketoglutarate dehydrogenase component 4-like [Ruditapes philippinarum]|uniref:alpha-ketoglutarate dehydrogenase component 4-like n=1 Tax=Ruditapes philippinarum TaxID=129788 RepID=UPI00295B13F5|nr:alpha-ketoglutarate dehydrogenase component 4-like [Ruditapes philippinarum]
MTSVARTFQAVKPHIPMIRFPNRVHEGVAGNLVQSVSQPINTPTPSSSRSPSSSPSLETVPSKYHRKPIPLEEMEYIERGGPE